MPEDNNKRQKLEIIDLNRCQEQDDGVRDIQSILQNRISNIEGETFQEKLNTLSRCNCCSKHQINKPVNLAPWVETPFNGTTNITCPCDCRHTARFICRQV